MGQEITLTHFSDADSQQFLDRLAEETASLHRFGRSGGFADARYIAGFELEAWLLDHAGFPNPVNEAYLRKLNDPLVGAGTFALQRGAERAADRNGGPAYCPPWKRRSGSLGNAASRSRMAWTRCWR